SEDPGKRHTVRCTEAQALLVAGLSKYVEAIDGSVDAKTMTGEQGSFGQELIEHLTSLSGASFQNAQSYMATATMMNVAAEAATYADQNPDSVQATIMTTQADEQRATQWATDADFYLKNVKIFLGFIEAVLYALAPLMAFIIMLGAV